MKDDEKKEFARMIASRSTDDFMAELHEKLGDVDEILLWLKEDVAPAYILHRVTEAKEKFDPSASAGAVLMDSLKKFQTNMAMLTALKSVLGLIDRSSIEGAKRRAEEQGDGSES